MIDNFRGLINIINSYIGFDIEVKDWQIKLLNN